MDPMLIVRMAYHRRTARILRVLEEQPSRWLSLEEAASIACMEPSSFSRYFHRSIGMTFSEFTRSYRVELAIRELEQNDDPIREIASRVGFGSLVSFQRAFKRCTGTTPSSFR